MVESAKKKYTFKLSKENRALNMNIDLFPNKVKKIGIKDKEILA
jgi:hypothetical protein